MAPNVMVQHTTHGVIVAGVKGWREWTFFVSWDCSKVEVEAPQGEEVTRELWRKMPMGTLFRLAKREQSRVTMAAADALTDDTDPFSSEHLQAVRRMYRAALRSGVPPRQAIGDHFQVSSRTVDRWISATRKRGLLLSWPEEQELLMKPGPNWPRLRKEPCPRPTEKSAGDAEPVARS